MDQRTSDRDAGLTTEFERDVVRLLLETVRAVGRQERADVGTEGLLYALVSGDWAAGSAIAPGTRASGTLGGSIGSRGTSVWVSEDKGDGTEGSPDDEREIDAVWREVRHEEAERLRWKNRKEETPQGVELPPMTGALRSCLRGALEAAREEGTVSVRVRHVARTLVELPDTRAREALVLEKLDIAAAAAALDALRGRDEAPEPGPVLLMGKAGTFGKSGNPLTRKVMAWVSGGGAGFGSAVVGAVRAEARRGAVRRGAPRTEPVDLLLGILALDRSLTVAGRELPGELAGANRGAELLRRHGARQGALARVLLPSTGVAQEAPPEDTGPADFEQRLLHVTQLTASAQGSPTVGTTHLLAALLDDRGTDAASAAEAARVLTESGVDVDGLRAEPELRVPGGAAEGV
ncbi:Clp protease N-terminal domain-containing protein [Streptomyces rochei]|uniref:Clp protease N-terminal domain-containing protein n=1 Tax=Streptomyces rochei TaxID=1928 RepID=UPI0037905D2C